MIITSQKTGACPAKVQFKANRDGMLFLADQVDTLKDLGLEFKHFFYILEKTLGENKWVKTSLEDGIPVGHLEEGDFITIRRSGVVTPFDKGINMKID